MNSPKTKTRPVILLVEDDPDDVFFARRALEKAGINNPVTHLENGEEAMKYLSGQEPYQDREEHPLPGLILLDLKMPRMGGLDVLKWLQQRSDLAQVPVVVLTGSIQPDDFTNAKNLGAVGYQVKPVEFPALLKLIRGVAPGLPDPDQD
jgi:CheY-like chemotaxis protein